MYVLSSFMTDHRILEMSTCSSMGTATRGAKTAYNVGVHGFTADYRLGSCFSIFSFVWEYMGSPQTIGWVRVSQSLVLCGSTWVHRRL